MDPNKLQKFVEAVQNEFVVPANLDTWLALHVARENSANIAVGATFADRVVRMVKWAEFTGRANELFQLLVDFPPRPGGPFATLIFWITDGVVLPSSGELTDIPGHEECFVTDRPFANRTNLRQKVATLGAAGPGPRSILVIEGKPQTGKTSGVRFAMRSAPQNGRIPVNVANWGSTQMYAWDLAAALYPDGQAELTARNFDPTKEDAAVPGLLTWLTGKLRNAPLTWILLDHCSRPNLTDAAGTLLKLFTETIDAGGLPSIRLVIADIDPAKLPALRGRSAWDTAELPDRQAVRDWCVTLASYLDRARKLKAPWPETEIQTVVDEVFEGLPAQPTPEALADVIEVRLNRAFARLKEH